MHQCGPGESMATVLGMQDVPHVFGMGLCLVSIQRARGWGGRGVLGAFWDMSLHVNRAGPWHCDLGQSDRLSRDLCGAGEAWAASSRGSSQPVLQHWAGH